MGVDFEEAPRNRERPLHEVFDRATFVVERKFCWRALLIHARNLGGFLISRVEAVREALPVVAPRRDAS